MRSERRKVPSLAWRVPRAELSRVTALSPSEDGYAPRLHGTTAGNFNARILARDPLCKCCLSMSPSIVSPSVEVDHIVPRHLGGTNEEGNMQGICVPCHRAKTASEKAARANGTAVYAAVVKPVQRERNIVFA